MDLAKRYNVIIIGSGFAGLSAAIEAKRKYNNVIVIDKLNTASGNSIISDGGIGVAGSDLQVSYGINDSPEHLVKDMLRAGQYQNDPDLVNLVAKHSNDAYEWTKNFGVKYQNRVVIFGGHSVQRCLTPMGKSGKDIIKVLYKNAVDEGVEFNFQTTVTKIIIKDNKTYKIETQNKNKTIQSYHVQDKLIIASGGFGSDYDLIKHYDPSLVHLKSTNLPTTKGDILTMMEQNEAQLIDMQEIQCGPWGSPDEKGFGLGPLFVDYIVLSQGILINPNTSKRFVNEKADRKIVSDAMIELNFAVALADSDMVKKSRWNLTKLLNKNIVKSFDSLNALAKAYDLDETILSNTINTYNYKVMHQETDEFHKDLSNLSTLSKAPFYTMKTVPKIHFTMGGLKINTRAQVIKKDGTPFDNIFAAGECTGGIHGRSRLGSMSITDCIVVGRIAGAQ